MFKKLIKNETDHTLIQLFRYSFTGTIAIMIDFYCLYILNDIFQFNYLFATGIAYLVGIIINFYLSTIWVFGKKAEGNFWADFGLFATIGIIGLFLVEVLMWFFTEFALWHYLVSKLSATMIVSIWNFYARKQLLYSENIIEYTDLNK